MQWFGLKNMKNDSMIHDLAMRFDRKAILNYIVRKAGWIHHSYRSTAVFQFALQHCNSDWFVKIGQIYRRCVLFTTRPVGKLCVILWQCVKKSQQQIITLNCIVSTKLLRGFAVLYAKQSASLDLFHGVMPVCQSRREIWAAKHFRIFSFMTTLSENRFIMLLANYSLCVFVRLFVAVRFSSGFFRSLAVCFFGANQESVHLISLFTLERTFFWHQFKLARKYCPFKTIMYAYSLAMFGHQTEQKKEYKIVFLFAAAGEARKKTRLTGISFTISLRSNT